MTQHLPGILPDYGAADSVKDLEEEEGNQKRCWKTEGEGWAKIRKRAGFCNRCKGLFWKTDQDLPKKLLTHSTGSPMPGKSNQRGDSFVSSLRRSEVTVCTFGWAKWETCFIPKQHITETWKSAKTYKVPERFPLLLIYMRMNSPSLYEARNVSLMSLNFWVGKWMV